jgi:hypothetical protein
MREKATMRRSIAPHFSQEPRIDEGESGSGREDECLRRLLTRNRHKPDDPCFASTTEAEFKAICISQPTRRA